LTFFHIFAIIKKKGGTKMLLDIGIPCFNEGKYLLKCLNSINKEFANDFDKIKIWVIDDDSPYGTEYKNIISQFDHLNIELIIMERNSGPGNCRNKVLELGEAEWITWIDDDDIFINNPLENVTALAQNPDLIRSEVYTQEGKLHIGLNTICNPVFGTIFNRKFLQDRDLLFIPDLGIVGTEDSIFLSFTTAMASKILYVESFIEHYARKDSQYTLTSNENEHLAIDLLPLCNICYMTKYKEHIKDFSIVWS